MSTIIVGIGTRFRGDDAYGLLAVERWRTLHGAAQPEVDVATLECTSLDLLPLLRGHDRAILVDAIEAAPADGIRHLHEAEMAAFAPGSGSAHGWGVAEALALARALPSAGFPNEIAIVGLPFESIEPGPPRSMGAARLIDQAVAAIQAELHDEPTPLASAA
jgi:hydrogenase maturation protease